MWPLSITRTVALGVTAALIVGAGLVAYNKGADSVQQKWDKEKAQIAQELLEVATRNQSAISDLQEDKHANLDTINGLRRDLAAAGRVRLPTCPDRSIPATTVRSADDEPAPAGDSADKAQEAFDRFADGLADDALEHDTVIEDCRVVAEWAKTFKAAEVR